MDLKIAIRNYQRLKKAEFTFVPGLNVIVGPSNAGKSATLRAIQTALFNLARDSHITMGETQAIVGLSYDGHKVIWKRNMNAASKTTYSVDGVTLTKVGRLQPPEVKETLGIFEVDVDDFKERLNFQKQMAYPFLLDRTPSQVFKFMAQSAEEDNLLEVLDKMKSDNNQLKQSIQMSVASADALKKALIREKEYLDGLASKARTAKELLNLDSKVVWARGMRDKIEEADSRKEAHDKAEHDVALIESVLNRFNLPQELDMALALELSAALSFADKYQARLNQLAKDSQLVEENLEATKELPRKKDFEDLDQLYALYKTAQSQQKSLTETKKNLQALEGVLGKVELPLVKEIESLEQAQALIEQADSIGAKISDLLKQERQVVNDLNAVLKELEEFSVCPYCGSQLEGNHGH